MSRPFAVKRLTDVPTVATAGDERTWHPLQHHFGLSAFGANVFVADEAGTMLVEEHDESRSGQEELYVVLRGAARFAVGGETVHAGALTVVAVREPTTRRRAVALEPGTMLLALGAVANPDFRSTWDSEHFADVPLA